MLESLMFLTLIAGAVIGIGQFFWFLRRRSNRQIASQALVGDGSPRPVSMHPEGALSELLGIGGVGLLAMALLLFAYNSRGYESAQAVQPPAETKTTPGAASRQMTQPTLPRSNPADMPNPPTSFPDASGNPVDPTKNNPPNTAR